MKFKAAIPVIREFSMTNPAFDTIDDRLTAYALGELDEAGRAEFERLLASRPDLQQELKDLEALTGVLRQELLAESTLTLTAEQHQQILGSAGAVPEVVVVGRPDPVRRHRVRRWAVISAEVALGIAVVSAAVHHTTANRTPRSVVDRFHELQTGVASNASADRGLVSLTESSGASRSLDREADSLGRLADTPRAYYELKDTAPVTESKVSGDRLRETSGIGSNLSVSAAAAVDSDATWADLAIAAEGRAKHAAPVVDAFSKTSTFAVNESAPAGSRPALAGASVKYATPSAVEYKYRVLGETESKGESYAQVSENAFVLPALHPLSTFSIDVDSASYANIRRFLTQGQLPPVDAVRVEEMVNYFSYDYAPPKPGEPFSVTADAAPCPWHRDHYLARVALQARTIDKAKRPPTNLVFLLDVSGSMQAANKLPLVKQAMTMLAEELNERDRIAIVTYAGDAGVKLASTPGSDQSRIMQSIEGLQAGGSTNGAAGINLAYEEALRHFNGEGENRVILCTDGDFNVGISDDEQLVHLIQQHAKSKVFLSIFGFGMGNLKDAKLEQLADKGNGHYGYIDDLREARRVFNEELVGTLYTVAKDVKIQVEFNPLTVGAYRLIGYENRVLAARDFNDDAKDAGEIGAGHAVTALYEIAPQRKWSRAQTVDALKYSEPSTEPTPVEPSKANLPPESADDLFTVKLRYKQPTADASVKSIDYVVDDIAGKNIAPSADFRWSAVVAAFGMQLRNSQFKGQWTLDDIYEAGQAARGTDANNRRREFLDLVLAAKRLTPTANHDVKAER